MEGQQEGDYHTPHSAYPYTLLSSLYLDQQWYTVLDLKDIFLSPAYGPQESTVLHLQMA